MLERDIYKENSKNKKMLKKYKNKKNYKIIIIVIKIKINNDKFIRKEQIFYTTNII